MNINALSASLSATTAINTKQPNAANSKNGNTDQNFSTLLSKLLNDSNKYTKSGSI